MADMHGEPTMEEILASIRRIIAEDPAPAVHGQTGRKSSAGRTPRIAKQEGEPAASASASASADESENTGGGFKAHLEAASESLDVSPPTESISESTGPAETPDLADNEAPTDEEVLELTDIAGIAAGDDDPVILSAATASVTAERLQRASDIMMRPEIGSPTLEGLVREMLRPMLKQWLDANLPDIVDQVVSREIARLTGRPR